MKRVIELPAIGTALTITADLLLSGGDVVVSFLVFMLLSIGDLLPVVSALSAYVAPQVEWIPSGSVETLLMAFALLYVGINLGQLAIDFRDESN